MPLSDMACYCTKPITEHGICLVCINARWPHVAEEYADQQGMAEFIKRVQALIE